jgi:hypothetical protein
MDELSPKSAAAQAKKAEQERQRLELREKRSRQLLESRDVIKQLDKDLKAKRGKLRLYDELLDHSGGLYEEVNKLAKGKTAFSATPLVRQSANDIIADAKKLIRPKEDIHMDRIKEFVPAGDEPSYPDVLVVLRSVRDCLKRDRKKKAASIKFALAKLQVASTAECALDYFLNDEDASEEEKAYPTKQSVQGYTNGTISDECFERYTDDSSLSYFDFDRLDSMSFKEYISTIASESGQVDEDDEVLNDFEENGDEGEEEAGDEE